MKWLSELDVTTGNLFGCIVIMIVAHGLVDFVLRRKTKDLKASWFLLHAASNTFIALTSLDSLVACITDPDNTINDKIYVPVWVGPGSKLPLACVNALHIYHCVAYDLSSADVFHHLMFLPFLGLPGVLYDWGILCNALAFFVCGVPGGIDYYLLGAQRCGVHLHISQPRVAARLNAWIRMSGVLISMGIVYPSVVAGRFSVPFGPLLTQFILMPINVIYYTISTARRSERKEIMEKKVPDD